MEKQKTVTRHLDELGRLVIPGDIREALEWGTGTKLEVAIADTAAKSVIVREVAPCCSLCRAESEGLLKVEEGYVCPVCAAKIK